MLLYLLAVDPLAEEDVFKLGHVVVTLNNVYHDLSADKLLN